MELARLVRDSNVQRDFGLNVSGADIARRWASSLPYGVPVGDGQVVLTNSDYTMGHGVEMNIPQSVSFTLRKGLETVATAGIVSGLALFGIGFISGFFTPHSDVTTTTTTYTPSTVPKASWRDGACPISAGQQCPKGYESSPPLLLVAFDGFRPSYLANPNIPAFKRIQECGVHARSMRPTHPTLSYPNHYSIVTGLHPESHGIVENIFFDPVLKSQFHYADINSQSKPGFWGGQPIWVTAKKNGKRAHAYMTFGSAVEIDGIRPDVDVNSSSNETSINEQMDTVVDWLSLPDSTRPEVTTLLITEPDLAGHYTGPESESLNKTLSAYVDNGLDHLMQGLHDRGILHCVNILVVSDHGMTDMNCDTNRIGLDPIFNASPLAKKKFNSSTDIVLYEGIMARISLTQSGIDRNITDNDIYDALQCKAPVTSSGKFFPYQLYRKEDLPRRLHYSTSSRLEPIILNLQLGHSIDRTAANAECFKGHHGYDNIYSDMQAIFLAQGPSLKSGLTIEPFQNIELYNLMCDLINVMPAVNNGTYGSLHHILLKGKTVSVESVADPTLPKYPATEEEVRRRQTPACLTDCVGSDILEADLRLNVSRAEIARRWTSSLPYGVPVGDGQVVLTNSDYTVGYGVEVNIPRWVSFTLQKGLEVTDQWFAVPTTCARSDVRLDISTLLTCTDLPGSGSTGLQSAYLFPPGLSSNAASANDAEIISNVVPMYEAFKTGTWSDFWRIFALWSTKGWKLNVLTGPLFDAVSPFGLADLPKDNTFSAHFPKLRIPSHFFVVVTRDNRNASCVADNCLPDVQAFILPHIAQARQPCQDIESYILTHSATVKDVEAVTGLRLYSDLPVYEAIRLRTQLPTKLWHRETGL
ncbi:Ectonucleotide pyrophosphatase/phosphodiesterase family member 3 [Hypsibius exemplaris]|uniref:Ectonucleotide pyrophosphatase/phosphodiesterase family member 3 n=1 Tax=Hypsibius exemplaris TaxID=2072580 RepID=A0A1W0WHI2_HYPEX|nr:Ectonucleotide pyrophosphatase/phosphodiesterase family member 3 [Hypsibius exemplaris]